MSHIQEIEKEFEEIFPEIMGLETDPDGTENMYLIRDENDNVENGIDFTPEKIAIKSFLRSSHLKYLTNKRKELEGELKKYDPNTKVFILIDPSAVDGYNLAKQEEIDKLNKEIKNI